MDKLLDKEERNKILDNNRNLKDYIDYLKYEKKYSNYTILNYENDIIDFLIFLNESGLNYKNIEYSDTRFYLMKLKDEEKLSNTSINRRLSSIRGFYKYLANNKIIDDNIFNLVNGPKREKKLPRYFEYNELEELFEVPDLRKPLGQRDRVILEILYDCGVRVGELVNIKVNDIDFSNKSIFILGKGNKERYVRFGDYAKDALKMYLNDGYSILNIRNIDYLLLNNDGEQLTDRGVRYILDRLISKTTLNKKISPHMLRHSFATSMLNNGADILAVQQLLGHESISSTQIYTHLSTEKLKETYYKSFPRSHKKVDK